MLVPIVTLYLLGVVLAGGVSSPIRTGLAVGSMAFAAVFVVVGREVSSRLWSVPLATLALAAGLATSPAPSAPLVPSGEATIEGRIESEIGRGETVDAIVLVTHGRLSDGRVVPQRARIRVLGASCGLDARVRVEGTLRATPPFRNASLHPAWPEARPTSGVLRPRAGRMTLVSASVVARAIDAARVATRRAIVSTLDPTTASVATALVLGDGSSLDPEDADAIRGAGLTHVLAVSGTHIAFVGGACVMLLAWLLSFSPRVHEPRRWAAALGIPIAVAHAAFAGSAPSAWRAAATASVAWTLVACGRRPDALSVTAFAAGALALGAPHDATRPGFLLSVLATAAVLTSTPAEGKLGFARSAFDLAVRSTVATAPVVLYGFGTFAPATVLANLALVPLGGVVLLPLALVQAALALLSHDLGWIAGRPLCVTSHAFLAGSAAFARVAPPFAIPPPTAFEGIAIAIACIAWLATSGTRSRLVVTLALLLAIGLDEAVVAITRPRGELALVAMDVGQGDALVLELPDGRHLLVDAGGGRPDPGARVLVPWLRAQRIGKLDVVVLSHPHPDHYGGLRAVFEAMRVGELWDTGEAEAEEPDGAAAAFLRDVRRRGVPIRHPAELCARPRAFARVRVEILHPCPGPVPSFGENDNSFVLRVAFGARSALLVGDAERRAEELLLRNPSRLRADVLKVGHHGSRTSSTPPFLRAVRPTYAIASAGAGNAYGHPHPEPLAALGALGTRIFRTDRHGGTRFATDGRRWTITPTVP